MKRLFTQYEKNLVYTANVFDMKTFVTTIDLWISLAQNTKHLYRDRIKEVVVRFALFWTNKITCEKDIWKAEAIVPQK